MPSSSTDQIFQKTNEANGIEMRTIDEALEEQKIEVTSFAYSVAG